MSFQAEQDSGHLLTPAPVFGQHTDYVLRDLLGSPMNRSPASGSGNSRRALEFDTA